MLKEAHEMLQPFLVILPCLKSSFQWCCGSGPENTLGSGDMVAGLDTTVGLEISGQKS